MILLSYVEQRKKLNEAFTEITNKKVENLSDFSFTFVSPLTFKHLYCIIASNHTNNIISCVRTCIVKTLANAVVFQHRQP